MDKPQWHKPGHNFLFKNMTKFCSGNSFSSRKTIDEYSPSRHIMIDYITCRAAALLYMMNVLNYIPRRDYHIPEFHITMLYCQNTRRARDRPYLFVLNLYDHDRSYHWLRVPLTDFRALYNE